MRSWKNRKAMWPASERYGGDCSGDYAYEHTTYGNRHSPPGPQVAVRLRRHRPHQLHFEYSSSRKSMIRSRSPSTQPTCGPTPTALPAPAVSIDETDSAGASDRVPTGIVVPCQNDRCAPQPRRPGRCCAAASSA